MLRMRVGDGRRGSGVQNAGALPCPRAFRPSGRVRYDLSSPVAASPPGSRGCVRRLGEARRPAAASAWCWICGVAPLGAFVRASSSKRLVVRIGAGNRGASLGAGSAGSLHSMRSMRADFSARAVFDSVPGNGALHSAPGLRGAPLGGIHAGGLLGAPGVRLGARQRGASLGAGVHAGGGFSECLVFDSVPRVCGRSTRCVREGGSA